ncbi:MAG: NAD-dependent epimerase/dehydratase family protein [Acidobacteriota bacterium]|nr:NAD-dependent epimerase/dehydratase family protein [Acidobacteriota bacterium]
MSDYTEKIRNKKVLVTGGLGFVGHNLVKALVNEYDCDVTVVDDCTNSNPKTLGDAFPKVRFQQLSVLDNERFLPLLKDQNYIFHLACIQISAAGNNANLDLRVNGESTLNILEYIRHNRLPQLERFIYTGSCSIFGSSLELPLNENSKPNILSHYAASKYLGETYTLLYNTKYDLPTACVRYSNVYGYGQSSLNPYCGVLGHFIHNALTNKPLKIYGDGEQTRDYTFVTDAVKATILAAAHPRAYGEIFNIGTSVETSVNKLADLILALAPDAKIENHPDRDIDNIRRRWVSIEHIHRKLGWVPRVGIAKGVEATFNWYKDFLK